MKTPMEEVYSQYEKFRGSKTKEEHANKFLAWFLAYKEQNLKKEEQVIIEANYKGLIKAQDDFPLADLQAEQYYTETFKK